MPMIPVGGDIEQRDQDGFRMNKTALDMDMDRIIWRMYGGYNLRGKWMYPHNRFGTGGLKGLADLGDYFDGINTWHYDAATNSYLDQNGNPSQPAPAPATTAPALTVGTSGGSTPNAQGGYTYNASQNTMLYSNPTGTTLLGDTQSFNPNAYATPEAAQRFADALGGVVINDPYANNFDQNQSMLAIKLPDGTVVNAGALAQILGNDAAYGNVNVKSGAIATLIGAAYQPGIAESLMSGTPANVNYDGSPPPAYTVSPTQYAAWEKKNADAVATTQAAASAVTNKPNQSVPPQNTLTPASSGISKAIVGGVIDPDSGDKTVDTSGDGSWFGYDKAVLLGGAALVLLFMMNSNDHGGGRR